MSNVHRPSARGVRKPSLLGGRGRVKTRWQLKVLTLCQVTPAAWENCPERVWEGIGGYIGVASRAASSRQDRVAFGF